MTERLLEPKKGNACYGCGADNDLGLKMSFIWDEETEKVSATYSAPKHLCGYKEFLHGGIIATLLDEVSSKVLTGLYKTGMTRYLNVEYLKPVASEQPLFLEAHCESVKRSKHFIHACIKNEAGDILAKSESLFIVLKI